MVQLNFTSFCFSIILCLGWQFALAQSNIVINELMASNDSTVADNTGEYDDWIELYNNSNITVDLSGWYITDKADNLDKYDIPIGTSIAANDYLIIWADEDSSQGPVPVHANFKLASSGELLILSDPFLVLIDSMSFGQQTTDMGYARVPNGTGDFVIQAPTFAANNDVPTSTNFIERQVEFRMFPNPTYGVLNIEIDTELLDDTLFEVFDAQGRKVLEQTVSTSTFQIDGQHWTTGLYVLKYGHTVKKLLMVR